MPYFFFFYSFIIFLLSGIEASEVKSENKCLTLLQLLLSWV